MDMESRGFDMPDCEEEFQQETDEQANVQIKCHPDGYLVAYGESLFSFESIGKLTAFINSLFNSAQSRQILYSSIIRDTVNELSIWDAAACADFDEDSTSLAIDIMDNMSRFLAFMVTVYGPIYDPSGKSSPVALLENSKF